MRDGEFEFRTRHVNALRHRLSRALTMRGRDHVP